MHPEFHILSAPTDTIPYSENARFAADRESASLGFLPEAVYREAAEQGKLLVALAREGKTQAYAGHLLYGGAFPHARIFQVFTIGRYRRKGLGRYLVEALVRRAEALQFMSIVAKVADDLAANHFWDRLEFEVVRTQQGGRSTGRLINVRIRELETPRLFGAAPKQRDDVTTDLRILSRVFDTTPIYVLDLNILHDLVKHRSNAEHVGRIVRASFNNLIRLAVTDEFIRELERTSVPLPSDPLLELALTLPRLSVPPASRLDEIVNGLGKLLFPNQLSAGKLRAQDHSDLLHIAIAIHHKASGFITGEKAILRARDVLQSSYSIDVVGASEFANTVEPSDPNVPRSIRALSGAQVLLGMPMRDPHHQLVEAFLSKMNCPAQIRNEALKEELGRVRRREIVTLDGQVVGFASWQVPTLVRPSVQAFICVDEDHFGANIAAEFLLDLMDRESLAGFPVQLGLHLLAGHMRTKQIALALGFRPSWDSAHADSTLHKIALGTVVTSSNWETVCRRLKNGMGLRFIGSMPTYVSPEQTLTLEGPTGGNLSISLEEIETLLTPCLFLLPGRPAAIVPIRRVYAADLIGGEDQLSLLESPEAVLLRERVYFSSPTTAAVLKRGMPVLFYESARKGGSASAIAIARVTRSDIMSKVAASQDLLRRGVLTERTLGKICLADTVLATTIDSIMRFRKPIKLDTLRRRGVVDGANLVTARRILPEQAVQLAEEGLL